MRYGRRAFLSSFTDSLSDIPQQQKDGIAYAVVQEYAATYGPNGPFPDSMYADMASRIAAAGGVVTKLYDAQGRVRYDATTGKTTPVMKGTLYSRAASWMRSNAWYVGGGAIIAGAIGLAVWKKRKSGRR